MLEHYYDVKHADQFAALFGGLAIGKNPTLLRNSFLILNLDFSLVKVQGTLREVEAGLHQHVNGRLEQFTIRYAAYIKRPFTLHSNDAVSSLESVRFAVQESGHSIYLLIDEYDNFANDVLMTKREQARLRALAIWRMRVKAPIQSGESRSESRH